MRDLALPVGPGLRLTKLKYYPVFHLLIMDTSVWKYDVLGIRIIKAFHLFWQLFTLLPSFDIEIVWQYMENCILTKNK